jgi:DNA-binding LacI/PurR family transcriptional regulator
MHDIAKEIGIAASSAGIIPVQLICERAVKTIGVIVQNINVTFFSDAIAGIEEACF